MSLIMSLSVAMRWSMAPTSANRRPVSTARGFEGSGREGRWSDEDVGKIPVRKSCARRSGTRSIKTSGAIKRIVVVVRNRNSTMHGDVLELLPGIRVFEFGEHER